MFSELNLLAILAAGLSAMILGGLWYSPLLFGNIWAKEVGLKIENPTPEMKKKMMLGYFFGLVLALLTAFVLAHLILLIEAEGAAGGAETAFWLWLGFVMPVMLGNVLWEQRSFKAFLIGAIYQLVNLTVAGLILSVWV